MKVEVVVFVFWGGFGFLGGFLCVFVCILVSFWVGDEILNKFGLMPASLEIQQGRVETGLRIARLLSSLKVSVDGHLLW